jgi:peptide/nickel transport system substrate-binding protein
MRPFGSFAQILERPVSWPVDPCLAERLNRTLSALLVTALAAAALGCGSSPTPQADPVAPGTARGGRIVVATRTDPQSFSWYTRHDASTYVVTLLTQAKLIRVNRATETLEPWLAEGWTSTPDGLEHTLKLRPGLRFSDGHALTSDDVLFSLDAAYAREAGSLLAHDLLVGGRPIEAAAPDAATVVLRFAAPYGPGLRILDNLPILPKHRLAPALEAGAFGSAWGLGTPVAEIVGAGPFTLAEYRPGERLVFARNPHFFRSDANGVALPYLDQIVVEVVSDQSANLLRFEAGDIDMATSEARHEDYAPLKRAADAGRLQLLDLGVALHASSFWINLKPGAFAGDPRAPWLQRDELRQAVSLAVDRALFADVVFLGAGVPVYGPVTPANRAWYSPELRPPGHDPARARALLETIGLADRNRDGTLEDAAGTPARFTLLTQKGQTALERGAAVIRDELKKIGMTVDVVPLEGNALVQRFLSGRGYDAVYFHFEATDTDPAISPDFWLSSGSAHVWNLGQKTPATPWERSIDALMTEQAASVDPEERRRLFLAVQRVVAEHLPVVNFAAPRVFVPVSTRVTNLTPAVSRPQLLWAADTLAVTR